VATPLFGDCHASYRIDAWRSAGRREYRVRVTSYYGGCRAGRGYYVWLALPKLPAGWSVGFTEARGRDRPPPDVWLLERIYVPRFPAPDPG
jgi:hypothetical protein